jgi:hypothetical protein
MLRANFKLYTDNEAYFPVLYLKVFHHPLDLINCDGGWGDRTQNCCSIAGAPGIVE